MTDTPERSGTPEPTSTRGSRLGRFLQQDVGIMGWGLSLPQLAR